MWGRIVESVVGAHLLNQQFAGELNLHYWRQGNDEVDFVVERAGRVTAIEVKSSRFRGVSGLEGFRRARSVDRVLIIGPGATPLEDFLAWQVKEWA